MASPPGNIPHDSAGSRRLWRIRIIAGASALLILAGAIVFVAVNGTESAGLLIFALPVFVPFVLVVWRLRGGPTKKALILAMRIGFVTFAVATAPLAILLGVLLMELSSGEGARITARMVAQFVALVAGYAALAWMQFTLRRDAEKAYVANWPEEEQQARKAGRTLGWVIGAMVVLAFLATVLPSRLPRSQAANEASAVGSLRMIASAANEYSIIFHNGFPPSLAVLGPLPVGSEPTCRQADLFDAVLASGSRSGYVFDYRPGPEAKQPVENCPPGAESFTVSARPKKHGTTGGRNFFMDESGIIRAATEDRAATEKDPRIDQ